MGVINRVPRGLLGVLDSKTLGQTPSDVSPTVVGSIAMLGLYLADIRLETADNQDLAVVTAGRHAEVTVPDGALWFVYSIGANYSPTAVGDSPNIAPSMRTTDGVIHNFQMNDFPNTFSSGSTFINAVDFSEPLICGPGVEFASFIRAPTGATTVRTTVLHRSVQV